MPLPPAARAPVRLASATLRATFGAAAGAACAGPLPPAYTTPAAARASAGDLYGALLTRFTNVERASRFETARQKIGRAALSPSGVYDDASIWTTVAPDGSRTLEVEAGAALGRLFSLDSVATAPAGDGTTRVDLTFGVRPDRLRAAGLAAFGKYVDKYVNGSRWAMDLEDGGGARWGELANGGGALRLRLRLRDGRLQTLDGSARPLPDDLLLRTDAYTKVLLFEAGAERLTGNFSFVRGPRERGWSIRWRQPPRWHIPLGMRHLINGALDRPFTGAGMHTDILLRDPGAPGTAGTAGGTVLVRQFDVAVQESALVRWFGGIGARAMSDLEGRAEAEQDRFVADMLRALRADVEAAYTR